jgi:hypothetical protein
MQVNEICTATEKNLRCWNAGLAKVVRRPVQNIFEENFSNDNRVHIQLSGFGSGLPDFSWFNLPKREDI